MSKEELIKEFNNTKFICGIEISKEQQRALKYAAIRLEQLDENKDQQIAELQAKVAELESKLIKYDYKRYEEDLVNHIIDLVKEKKELQQQLKSQPNQIVEDIKNTSFKSKVMCDKQGKNYGNMTITYEIFEYELDNLLKKYGGEDDK